MCPKDSLLCVSDDWVRHKCLYYTVSYAWL